MKVQEGSCGRAISSASSGRVFWAWYVYVREEGGRGEMARMEMMMMPDVSLCREEKVDMAPEEGKIPGFFRPRQKGGC